MALTASYHRKTTRRAPRRRRKPEEKRKNAKFRRDTGDSLSLGMGIAQSLATIDGISVWLECMACLLDSLALFSASPLSPAAFTAQPALIMRGDGACCLPSHSFFGIYRSLSFFMVTSFRDFSDKRKWVQENERLPTRDR